MKRFNTTGVCIPDKHYMVDISERVKEIKRFVDDGKYFAINRARQYGKTTTLAALRNLLSGYYSIISLNFQQIGNDSFKNEGLFSQAIARIILDLHEFEDAPIPSGIADKLAELDASATDDVKLDKLFRVFKKWTKESDQRIVLMIDEVDSATNNQVFLDFLAQLRDGYISRDEKGTSTFQSVILAGVTDVKHLKSKIREDADVKVNSPWNIAADFNIDMSLSENGIRDMLDDYEADHHIGMDTAGIAKLIREYTSGYPFLVSRICQLIDEQLVPDCFATSFDAWTSEGVDQAVKSILSENNTLFQSITGRLTNYPELKASIRSILMEGTRLTWNSQQDDIVQMQMHGLISNDHNSVRISNRIFETMLYNLFLSEEELKSNVFSREGDLDRNQFVQDGKLDVRLIMDRFIITYTQIFGPLEDKFREKDGRELFLLYLKPIINGTGNYYIEAQTRDQRRTDVIIDYLGKQYIIELKIWHGDRYNEKGEKQIIDYLDYFGLSTGYMLSFNFNKHKKSGVEEVHIGDKVVFEGVV